MGMSMKMESKHILVFVILLWLFLPTTSNASWSDLQWRIEEGDRIHYTYSGWRHYNKRVNETTVELTETLLEDMYFVVEDLWGIPIPSVDGSSIAVSPYWVNGTPFEDSHEPDAEWYIKRIDEIDQIAVRVGNWTLYAETAETYWTSLEWGSFDMMLNETSNLWNISITTHIFENYLDRTFSYSYSKFDGVLNYSNYTYYMGSEDEPVFSVSLSRIIDSPVLQYELVIGIAAVAAVLILIIIIVVKRR
jgi:hypothetical protein